MTCKTSLWDSTPIGKSIYLHLCQYEPQLILEDKVFRSAICLQNNSKYHSQIQFIGTLISDDQSQRLTYVIDRLLSTNEINNHHRLTGEFVIPIQCNNKNSLIQNGIKEIDAYCHSSLPIEVHRFLYVCGQMFTYNSSSINVDLSFNLVTINNIFKLTPINSNYIQILPTTLLKNLTSSIRNNIYMTQPHFGYCSLDQISKNKILLILNNDPQVSTLPLIGIWISGIIDIQCTFVWAVCIRYSMNLLLKQRHKQSFLLIYYLSNQCIFYEVNLISNNSISSLTIDYDLWLCSKKLTIPNSSLYQNNINFSTQFTYDFDFKLVYDGLKNISQSPNTNGSLFGVPRLPPKQTIQQSPSWDSLSTPTVISDTRWKEELIEKMNSYEAHIQLLTSLVTQLLTSQKEQSQQNLIKQCTKHDVAVQSEPLSSFITTSDNSPSSDLNPVDILKPIFQFIDNQQQQSSLMTTYNSTDGALLKINNEEKDHQTQQQQHVTSTRTTGISLISNGVQMQFINQQSSTTTVYPQSQSTPSLNELPPISPQKSENNLSIEVHGLEMKYLEDDQLAVAIECDRQSQASVNALPQTSQSVDKSLSFGTEEYLRRYELLTDSNHE